MRLIDADKLSARLSRNATPYFTVSDIENAPTIDAVPVVRCKDCNHGMRCVDGYVRCSHPSGKSILMKSSDFCSYGKRKEGAE